MDNIESFLTVHWPLPQYEELPSLTSHISIEDYSSSRENYSYENFKNFNIHNSSRLHTTQPEGSEDHTSVGFPIHHVTYNYS